MSAEFNFRNLSLFFLLAAFIYVLVISGFDWQYHLWIQANIPLWVLLVADVLGFLLPIFFLIYLFIKYYFTKDGDLKLLWKNIFRVSFLATTVGVLVSFFFKAIAGRESPPHKFGFISESDLASWVDNSQNFYFGFLNEQIIGGFPSGHATVWCALAFTFFFVFIKNKINYEKFKEIKFFKYFNMKQLSTGLFILTIFISFGVSFGFHFLSDVVAGCLLGFIIAKILNKIRVWCVV